MDKLLTLIEECQYGIHDLSYVGLDPRSKFPRFNMPFELGLFIGAARLGDVVQKSKQFLILDKTEHRFRKIISDISGEDVKEHRNTQIGVVSEVTNRLKSISGGLGRLTEKKIYESFRRFTWKLLSSCKADSRNHMKIPYVDLTGEMKSHLDLEAEVEEYARRLGRRR